MSVEANYTVLDVLDRILDKGLAINADISISLAGMELLGIRIRASIASFETAAKYGMEFPAGANMEAPGWKEARLAKEECPGCRKNQPVKKLLDKGCPWCGWVRGSSAAAAGIT